MDSDLRFKILKKICNLETTLKTLKDLSDCYYLEIEKSQHVYTEQLLHERLSTLFISIKQHLLKPL